MNYELVYFRLINNAKSLNRTKCGTELHHIKPRCEGGTNESYNLVRLTPREHFLAHLLLAKWKGGKHWLPIQLMVKPIGIRSSKLYQKAVEIFREKQSDRMKSSPHHLRGKTGKDHYLHGKRLANNGTIQKYVAYLPEGWEYGVLPQSKNLKAPKREEYSIKLKLGIPLI